MRFKVYTRQQLRVAKAIYDLEQAIRECGMMDASTSEAINKIWLIFQ